MSGIERPSWDDRKDLLDIWQQHAPLPDIGLREGIFDALIAVAGYAFDRAADAAVVAEELEWEPSEAAAEVVARALFARTKEGGDGWTWPIDQWRRERDMDAARAVLKRAHAAGMPAKQEEQRER